MKKSILRVCSFLMILILGISNLPIIHAEGSHIAVNRFSDYAVNPMLGDIEIPQTVYSKRYASLEEETFNPEDFLETEEEAAAVIREAIEARDELFTLRYISDQVATEQEVIDLIEVAFAETDQPTEGDSLRYAWKSRAFEGECVLYENEYYTTIHFTYGYYTTAEQEAELTEAVDALVASFGFTNSTDQRAKIDKIYDYITSNVTYDYEHLEQEDYWLQYTAYAALVQKTAVCEGYAVLLYRLAEECGLDARVITGVGGSGRDANHAWNIIGLEDLYYYLDATWDAERSSDAYEWYLKGNTDFFSHSNEPQFNTVEFNERYPIPDKGLTFEPYEGPYTFGDFEYYANSSNAVITKYIGSGAEVIVPAEVGEIPVIGVDTGAFYQNYSVESLAFSEGILSLSPQAVQYCFALKSVHFPSTMNIRDRGSTSFTEAPIDCHALETITVAEGNPYIKVEDGILYNIDKTTLLLCPALYPNEELVIPDGVVTLANNSVADCTNIKEVKMPDSVEYIWSWVFASSNNLEKVNVSEKCTVIGQFFLTSTKVEQLHIPASVTVIMPDAIGTSVSYLREITVDPENTVFHVENGALYEGETLIKYPSMIPNESFEISEGTQSIAYGAFYDAKNLKSITIPAGVKNIYNSAFSGCAGLTHVTIPEGVAFMEKYIFYGCTSLMSVSLPESLTTMEDYNIFHPCDALTIYGKRGTLAETCANENSGFIFKDISEFVCVNGHNQDVELIDWQTEFNKKLRYECSVCGCKTIINYVKLADDILEAEVVLEYTEAEYDGYPHQPAILSVSFDGKELSENVDYTMQYFSEGINADQYAIEFKGIGKFAGTKTVLYQVLPKPLGNITVKNMQKYYPYHGYNHYPQSFSVYDGNEEISWENLYCEYANNREIGVGTIFLKGRNNYSGTVEIPFYIYPAESLGVTDLGGDENIALSGGVSNDDGLITVDLLGAPNYIVKTYSPHGSVKVYADEECTVEVSEGQKIVPDSGITRLYAQGFDASGNPVKSTIEIISPIYSNYTDTLTSWAKKSIKKLNDLGLGLIKGDGAGRFNGQKTLSRYEMATMMVRLKGINAASYKKMKSPFTDEITSWAKKYVNAAYKNGIVSGIGTEFVGDKAASRNEFFRVLMNVTLGDVDAYYKEHKEEINAYVQAQNFKDIDKVKGWAKSGTYTAIYLGYVAGDNGYINPLNTITRNEAAVMLARILT